MAKALTAKSIENLRVGTGRREVPDGGCVGLYIVVQRSGVKSWAVRYRLNSRPAKYTIGRFPTVSLASARQQATTVLKQVANGVDPAVAKRQSEAEAAGRKLDTVQACYERWHAARRDARESTRSATAGIFRREILPAWGKRSVHDIKRRDVIDLVDRVCATRPVAANRVLTAVSTFFDWLMNRDVIVASPAAGVRSPTKEKPRERKLSDDEIIRFWVACDTLQALRRYLQIVADAWRPPLRDRRVAVERDR